MTRLNKLGGLTQSPLQTWEDVFNTFAQIANGIDPEAKPTEYHVGVLREFIQGWWNAEYLATLPGGSVKITQ